MPRANRHYIPGVVWHITHRCHKKEFLLKFARDRRRWLQWLFEAKKRFGLSVLNYMATSNHILCGAPHNRRLKLTTYPVSNLFMTINSPVVPVRKRKCAWLDNMAQAPVK